MRELIYKLPVILSTISAIITLILALVNKKSFDIMAIEISFVIVITYILGLVLKIYSLNSIKEALRKKQAVEEQKRKANKAESKSHGENGSKDNSEE